MADELYETMLEIIEDSIESIKTLIREIDDETSDDSNCWIDFSELDNEIGNKFEDSDDALEKLNSINRDLKGQIRSLYLLRQDIISNRDFSSKHIDKISEILTRY